MAAVPFCVEMHPVIVGGHLKEPVLLKHVQEVEGRMFFKACKKDAMITRLLAGCSVKDARPLAKTDVLEQLVARRNSAVQALHEPQVQDDLALDQPAKKRRHSAPLRLHELPAIIDVDAPTIAAVEGLRLSTLPTKGQAGLWLELTSPVIRYLTAAVQAQMAAGEIQNVAPRQRVPEDERAVELSAKGVSYEYRRDAYRMRKGGKDKYFSTKSHAGLHCCTYL